MIYSLYVEYSTDGDMDHLRQMDGMIERIIGKSAMHTGAFLMSNPVIRDMEFEIQGAKNVKQIFLTIHDEIHKSCGPLFPEEFRTEIVDNM